MSREMVRIKCNRTGLFGTLAGGTTPRQVRPGTLLDVVWLDYPKDVDEIDGGNVTIVPETTFHLEVIERGLDRE